MSDDIVERLRTVLNHDRSVELITREAADEIERLRVERDEARRMYLSNVAATEEEVITLMKVCGWDFFKEVKRGR